MAEIKINTDSLKNNRQWVRHKIKEGTTAYRILPPFGDLSNGYPYRKWQLVWGLKDPERGTVRPFVSPLATEKRCPITALIEGLQQLAEERTKGMTKEDARTTNTDLNKAIGELRPKTIFLYNAVDQAGTVGILEVKSTAHKKLKKLMMDYINDYGQDPTSLSSADDDSGVWFNFIRTGLGFDTEYDVEKKQTQTKLNGQIAFIDDRSALPEQVIQKYDELAYDVHTIYQVKTYDELLAILVVNLKDLGEKCPEVVQVAEKLGFLTDAQPVVTTAVKTETAPAAQAKTKPAAKVDLKLLDEDDKVAATAPATAPATTQPTTAPAATDEIFDMADKILND